MGDSSRFPLCLVSCNLGVAIIRFCVIDQMDNRLFHAVKNIQTSNNATDVLFGFIGIEI